MSTEPTQGGLSRRELLGRTAGALGAAAAAPLVAAAPAAARPAQRNRAIAGKGKVVIGAFADGGLTPFKDKIIPLFQRQTGIKVEWLEDEYGVTYEKFFNDAQSGGGQYDLYVLDDPWVPAFAAADVLEDLGAAGVKDDGRFIPSMMAMGYWPPKQGPRIKGFEKDKPRLVAVPFVGDLQTMTYRNDVFKTAPKTWDELVKVGKAHLDAAKKQYGFVFRGVASNPIVTSWYPIFLSFGGQFFDNDWNVTFNNAKGKASAEFFVGTLKSIAPPGVVEYDSDQEGAAILGGHAFSIIQYSGNAIKSDDPKQTKLVGKLDFGVVPKQEKALAQMGIFIHGVPKSAPNKENAITFSKWYATDRAQIALARAGSLPVKRPAFLDAQARRRNRLTPVALRQLDAGAVPRPRTPDWSKVEEYLGIELNKALQKGSGGGAALDAAAKKATAYLKRQGYYS